MGGIECQNPPPPDADEPLECGAHFHSVEPSDSRRGSGRLFKDGPERPDQAHSQRSPRVVKIGKRRKIRSEQVSRKTTRKNLEKLLNIFPKF